MPFTKRDASSELKQLNDIIKDNPQIGQQLDELSQLYMLQKSLVEIRKERQMTQVDLSVKSGLSQQQISRVETGNCNILTFLKYLNGIDYKITLTSVGK